MTEGYLLLIEHFKNDNIYIDHDRSIFVISDGDIKKNVRSGEVKEFITTFVSNKKNKDGK